MDPILAQYCYVLHKYAQVWPGQNFGNLSDA